MDERVWNVHTTGERLDLFLVEVLGQTRNQVAQFLEQHGVWVDDKQIHKGGMRLKEGQKVRAVFPTMHVSEPLRVDFDVKILYEDEDLLVIDKPSGLTVHPAPSVKEATLVDWLKHHNIRLSTLSGEERHGIVHRLDRGTSGVMVIAKTNEAHEALSLQLQDKSMGRYYLAFIHPPLKHGEHAIDKPIGRSANNRLKMAITPQGKGAQTAFRSILTHGNEELILCRLSTGRTHQIRVHLESFGRHIIGDHLYGEVLKGEFSERILLHALHLYFVHPRTHERMCVSAYPSGEMERYILDRFDPKEYHARCDLDFVESLFARCESDR